MKIGPVPVQIQSVGEERYDKEGRFYHIRFISAYLFNSDDKSPLTYYSESGIGVIEGDAVKDVEPNAYYDLYLIPRAKEEGENNDEEA